MGGREFGHFHPLIARGGHVVDRCVIMAGQGCTIPAGGGYGCGLMRRPKPCIKPFQISAMRLECGLIHGMLSHHILGKLRQVGKLPLSGGVVHQTDDAHPVSRAEFVQFFHQGFRTGFGAQMQMMTDPERRRIAQRQNLIGHGAGIFVMTAVSGQDRTHPQRIKHRADPAAGQFGVMRQNCCIMRPVDPGPGRDVLFQIIDWFRPIIWPPPWPSCPGVWPRCLWLGWS